MDLKQTLIARAAEFKGIPRICVGVCTARRPQMLARCLDSLIGQKLDPEIAKVDLIVVDNNHSPDAKPIVDAVRPDSRIPIHYVHEPRMGIPIARNAVLEKAIELEADWIAFIDDDEFADADWLLNLFDRALRYHADVIHGQVRRVCLDSSPFWADAAGTPKNGRSEGEIKTRAATDNVIFSAVYVNGLKARIRFDETLRFTGGSDGDFFIELHRAGAKIVYSSAPKVTEELPRERLSLHSILLRSYRIKLAELRRYKRDHGRAKLIMWYGLPSAEKVVIGAMRVIIATLMMPVARQRAKKLFMKGAKQIYDAAAFVAGVFSLYPNPYIKIVGYSWLLTVFASEGIFGEFLFD